MAIPDSATPKDYSILLYNKTEIDTINSTEQNRVNTALESKVSLLDVGNPNGLATLGEGGTLKASQIPIATNVEALNVLNTSTVITPYNIGYILEAKNYLPTSVAISTYGNFRSDGTIPMDAGYIPQGMLDVTTVNYVQNAILANTTTYVKDTVAEMLLISPIVVGDVCFVTNDGLSNGEYLCVTPSTGGSAVEDWALRPDVAAWGTVTGTLSDQTDLQNVLDTKVNVVDIAKLAHITVTQPVNLDTMESSIATNTADIAVLESINKVAISIVSTSALSTQTLTSGTAERLRWMTTALVDAGGSDISYSISTDNILIGNTGIYKVYGVLSAIAPINDIVDVELYIDNLPTGFKSSCIGRGNTSAVTFVYTFMSSFAINDDISLYVTSTGTEITVQSASVTVEKTTY